MDEQNKVTLANKTTRLIALREAASVMRCHTMRAHHRPSIADHCYNMVNMLLVLHPDPPINLVKACMWHDVPERWLGDMPAPTKWRVEGFEKMESHVLSALQLGFSLSEEDQRWLQGLDMTEILLWAKEELSLGNQNVGNLVKRVSFKLQQDYNDGILPTEIAAFLDNHRQVRLSDDLPGF